MTPSRTALALLLLVPAVCFAASGDTMSGSTMDAEQVQIEEMWNERRLAVQGFRAAVLAARKELTAHEAQQNLRRGKRTELLTQCRKDIRAANRDTLFRETLRCFRALLTGDMEIMRKEKQSLGTVAGVPADIRSAAESAIQKLMDALATVSAAVDAGVYGSKEDLEEAKKNLQAKYREAVTDAMLALRIARRDTWITHLTVHLHDKQQEPGMPEYVVNALGEAIACLEQKQELLRGTVPGSRAETLAHTRSELPLCITLIREAHSLYKEFEQTETSSGTVIE